LLVSETNNANAERRHSVALEADLIKDPVKRAEAEAANGLRQFDAGKNYAQAALDRQTGDGSRFKLRPSLILSLHREALAGISTFAGPYRPAGVSIEKSKHVPPGAHLVAELVEDMCEYVNDQWQSKAALHLAAYVMWRLNWIHPFADGNGRTSRITSYVVLTISTGYILPGSPSIPDQIVSDRSGYFLALDQADEACRADSVDVTAMEDLLGGMLARQLAGFYRSAGGKLPPGVELDSL
jgi:Fic family protein